MITFPCHCKHHRFAVPESEAGAMVQCPLCKRLNDVPTLSDLRHLEDDGTLKLSDAPVKRGDDGRTLREMHRVYGKRKTDDDGTDIDLRHSLLPEAEEIPFAEPAPLPRETDRDAVPTRPKYDPITGELVRDLDVRPVAPKKVIPVPPRRQGVPIPTDRRTEKGLLYDRRKALLEADDLEIPTFSSLPIRLLSPINAMVMAFTAFGMFLLSWSMVPLFGGLFFVAIVPLIIQGLILAHYGNCIEELGPVGCNEIPRPLRFGEFLDDMWWPFTRMAVAVGLTIVPSIVFAANTDGGLRFVGGLTLLAVGLAFFPAVALITCASGAYSNLRPDRLLGTMACLGGGTYILAVLICAAAVVLNLMAIGAVFVSTVVLLTAKTGIELGVAGSITLAVVLAAVYMSHLACWWLGVLHRRNYDRFPWLFEEHERQRAEHKRLVALQKAEAARQRQHLRP